MRDFIEEIPPGGAASKFFEVNSKTAGPQQIAVHLDPDAVAADNHRFAIVDLPVEVPVLLIDGSTKFLNSHKLQDAMAAPGPVALGIDARRIEPPKYLSLPSRPLDEFAVIAVSGVERVDQAGVEALEKYVREGGGAFFVASATTAPDFVNRALYRDGKGLFPVPLAGPAELNVDPLDNTPDVQSEDHPVFGNIGNRAGYISKIYVKQYFGIAKDWDAKKNLGVRVIMRLRNGAPLLVEKSFGRGRVMVLLTSLSEKWSNWVKAEEQGSAFLAFIQNMVAYLSRRRPPTVSCGWATQKQFSYLRRHTSPPSASRAQAAMLRPPRLRPGRPLGPKAATK